MLRARARRRLFHTKRTVYDPTCLQYCKELCGVRCKNLCNETHGDCARGHLPDSFLFCPTAVSETEPINLGYVNYENRDVDTFGKATQYKRVEKIVTDYPYNECKTLLKSEFDSYAEHTLSYWFL